MKVEDKNGQIIISGATSGEYYSVSFLLIVCLVCTGFPQFQFLVAFGLTGAVVCLYHLYSFTNRFVKVSSDMVELRNGFHKYSHSKIGAHLIYVDGAVSNAKIFFYRPQSRRRFVTFRFPDLQSARELIAKIKKLNPKTEATESQAIY